MIRPPPRSPLFPYTTLSRSAELANRVGMAALVKNTRQHKQSAGRDAVSQHNEHGAVPPRTDRKSTRLNSSHGYISYAVFCLKKKKTKNFVQDTSHIPAVDLS